MDPRTKTPEAKAETLGLARVGIESSDERIVREWVLRGAWVMKGGRQKPLGVTSPERQQEVIEHVRVTAVEAAAAQGAGLKGMPELIVEMYEWMIPRIVELQQAQLAEEQGVATNPDSE